MRRNIIFNVTKMGASHLKSGKPCQDYSLNWESDDKEVMVAIVCDGHGADTYVRSEVGSKLAAEIALQNIQSFVSSVSPGLFVGMEGAVTARPEDEDDSLFPKSRKSKPEDLTESELQQVAQNEAFYEAVENIREQDNVLSRLFAGIYLQWKEAIQKDANERPFNEYEKSCLKNARIAKAYGTTLMAFVRTPLYWFAFHIGDGKLLCCDRNMSWYEPVPWDCNCFLNMTTSMCNSNPIPGFRYAFNGKGNFPVAVIMGSDGLDDSWGTPDRLQNFYSQTLEIFDELGETEALKQLDEYLPRLSEKASRDDMSMAGIIDMDAIKIGVNVYKKQRELRTLKTEKDKKDSALATLQMQQQKLEQEISLLSESTEKNKNIFLNWLENLKVEKTEQEQKIQLSDNQLKEKITERKKVEESYQEQYNDYQSWAIESKALKNRLMNECEELKNFNAEQEEQVQTLWHERKFSFEEQENIKKQEWLREKADRMEECNEEALQALQKEPETNAANTDTIIEEEVIEVEQMTDCQADSENQVISINEEVTVSLEEEMVSLEEETVESVEELEKRNEAR